MKELEYPFDAQTLLSKKKSLRKRLLQNDTIKYLDKKIAIPGGQTTEDIKLILELFLLNQGIRPQFYQSEFNQWYEDGCFANQQLANFAPDLIYICTCVRNITNFPLLADTAATVEQKRQAVLDKFTAVWDHLTATYHCPIIQNNFEYPYFRLLGNKDASDIHGRVNFVTELNAALNRYAQTHPDFYLCDINYISATYGLDQWSDPYYWHMYKYATAVPAIPYLAFNIANIIKSIYGKNKKVLNLDLDNTLWGGIVGDDGAENLEIGQETATAQLYSEFQSYLKLHNQLGILLTINSKNDEANALAGLQRPDSVLHPTVFVSIKANWNPEHLNLAATAQELALLPESFVFVDDNPAERAIITSQLPGVAVPELGAAEHYLQTIDRSGFFEVTALSSDDLKRTNMYKENAARSRLQATFTDYAEYLASLGMRAEIQPFVSIYLARIAQLTNKSNQFNLTTKRYSQSEIEAIAQDPNYLALYGKLTDKFGDNGVVGVVIGRIGGTARDELRLELWLMSCRVLKRGMEFAMMDELVQRCRVANLRRLYGYYYPTAKNKMVQDFYQQQRFKQIQSDPAGNTVWELTINDDYQNKQHLIAVN